MPGTQVIFSLDLFSIPCQFQGRGDKSPVHTSSFINDLHVSVELYSENSPGMTKASTGESRFFYNKIKIKITDENEDLTKCDFIEGRAYYILTTFQRTAIDAINRLIHFFKYHKHHPNLRAISEYDLLNQSEAFYNPAWFTQDGEPLKISESPIKSGAILIPGIGLLQDNLFGITAISTEDQEELQKIFSMPASDFPLSSELLSDAQNAAIANNIRRAVLELAIAIEIFVKNFFFKKEKIAAAAFEYLEDKGRESIKVTELLDGVAKYAFLESFKSAHPSSFQQIDYIFRCRNKIAHRGEAIYRDDGANWNRPDSAQLRIWWVAAFDMFNWLDERASASNNKK